MAKNLFQWNNDFNTGNKVVDKQHFELVKLINDLLDLSINNNSINEDQVQAISYQLRNYVTVHFSTEEALMREYSVDDRHSDEHIESHHDFIREVTTIFEDLTKLSDIRQFNEIIEYLVRWLAYHILNTDKSLIKQIENIKNKSMSPEEAYEAEDRFVENSTEPLLKAVKILYLLVSRKNKEIEKKNLELEERVKERTAELLEANEKMSRILFEDALTALPNRRYAMEELQKLLYNWERYQISFTILFIDLDKFKPVNDTFGHEVGDKVLIWFAELLKKNVRKTDIACRIGGDEFLVICPHTNRAGGESLMKKLKKLCTEKHSEISKYWHPSMSMGLSTIHDKIETCSDMLKEADKAMYQDKKSHV